MTTFISPKEGADRFRSLEKEIQNESVKALRRATHAWRKRAFQIFSQRGLGRVFGDEAVLGTANQRASTKQARVIIQRDRVRKTGDGLFTTGLRLRGFAALVEGGGRTRPHEIRARSGSVLGVPPQGLGTDARGKPIFATRVNQRMGARIPRNPFVEAAGRQSQDEFKRQMEIAVQRSIELAKLAN